MEEKLKSEGVCIYCGKKYSKQGISRHLSTHLNQLPASEKHTALHLRVDGGPYFLNLLVDAKATLSTLDEFLRDIWLECCGHLSRFSYASWGDELPQDGKMQRFLSPGTTVWYAYDFGSTTELTIRCLAAYPADVKRKIDLLSRNEPFPTMCDRCGKAPAERLCTGHWSDEEERFFCESCAAIHEEACVYGEQMVPVTNSPRMGQCGYDGGRIDVERDRFKG
ncbi:MAG: hypothetical protein IPK21_23280 [Haliscomenobacter sp.]|nr:hypothetical protein [Haliscomenobacter sp.]